MWKFLTSSRASGAEISSPDGRYTAIVGSPDEIWGNYIAPIALWTSDRPHKLLYHREGYVAHALSQATSPIFLYWSSCSSWLTFYEFKRQESYQIVFINVLRNEVYKVPASDTLIQKLPQISLSEVNIEALLQQEKHTQTSMALDPVSLKLFRK